MSVVTSVPALPLNAVFGKRSAPSRTAPSARCSRTAESLFVHRVAARNQRDQPARSDHVKGLREEIVVDATSQMWSTAIGWIEGWIVSEGNVSDCCVEEILRKCGVFEGFGVNVGI